MPLLILLELFKILDVLAYVSSMRNFDTLGFDEFSFLFIYCRSEASLAPNLTIKNFSLNGIIDITLSNGLTEIEFKGVNERLEYLRCKFHMYL